MVGTVTENNENAPVENAEAPQDDSSAVAGSDFLQDEPQAQNLPSTEQQSLENQPTNQNSLSDEAKEYGFSEELINSLPPDQLNRVMMEFDKRLLGSPNGMMGQTPQNHQQQTEQNQQQNQQPEPLQNEDAPNWDDDEVFDPDQAKGLKYLHQQIQQVQGFMQQQAAQAEMQQFMSAIDGLKSEVLSSEKLDSQEMQMVAQYYDQFRMMGLEPEMAVKRSARALGISSHEELKSAAQDRQSQFSGSPARSSNGQFQTAVDLVREKLADAGGNTYDVGSDFEGFLT